MFKTANNDGISRPNSRPKLPFPGNGKGRDWKFEACIPGNHGKREFPLTPVPLSIIFPPAKIIFPPAKKKLKKIEEKIF